MRPSGDQKVHEYRRIYAMKLIQQGKSNKEIASELNVSTRSVCKWKSRYSQFGPNGVLARPNRGRPSFLSRSEKAMLEKLLLQGAKKAGFETDLWTCPRVAELIKRRFGVAYHIDHIGRLLHGLGWSPQNPPRQAVEYDEAAVRLWVKRDWPRIKKTRRLNARIVFIDESGFLMAPFLRRTWAPKGQTPILKHIGKLHAKVSAIAALSMTPCRRRMLLYFRLHPQRSIDASLICQFLHQLRRQIRHAIIIVLDRLRAHKALKVRRMVERCTRPFLIEYLPAYAPSLNPLGTFENQLACQPVRSQYQSACRCGQMLHSSSKI